MSDQPSPANDPTVPVEPSVPSSKPGVWLTALGLFVAVAWTFFPARSNDFVSLDDPAYVLDNVHVRTGLTLENVRWAFSSTENSNWHPLTWISHMLDCQFAGLNPHWHHLTNVWLHAANAVLVFLVLYQMTGGFGPSLAVAALFGLHPLRTESVAWVAERKDVLSTLFWLLTVWAYARYVRARTLPPRPPSSATIRPSSQAAARNWYMLALAFFVLGLMSKPMLVTVPFVLLLLDHWPLRRFRDSSYRALALEKVPFLLAALAVSGMTIIAQRGSGALKASLPLSLRLENTSISYVRYLANLFWPSDLAAFYPYPQQWPMAWVIGSLLLLLALTALVVMSARRHPYVFTGWFWFLGTLVPVIGLVQVGVQSLADRYTYVPLLGILMILGWGGYELTRASRMQTMGLAAAGTAAAVVCALLTRQQIGFWKDSVTLFRHTILVTKENYMAHFFLGNVLAKQGRVEDAITEYREASRLRPNVDLSDQLGNFLDAQGRLDDAIVQFQEAVSLDPGFAEPHYHLAFALYRKGRLNEAITEYQTTLKLAPNHAEARGQLGMALGRVGRLEEAVVELRQALKLKPDSPDLRYNLGNALLRAGRLDEAILEFQEALARGPDSADVHNNLGAALTRKGRLDEAISHLQAALRLEPDHVQAGKNLAAALAARNATK